MFTAYPRDVQNRIAAYDQMAFVSHGAGTDLSIKPARRN